VIVFNCVGVFDVEVVVASDYVFYFDFPGVFAFFALVPPGFFGGEFIYAHGFGFGVGLVAGGVGVFVVPDFFCGFAFGEEEEIGFYAGVGAEDAVWEADYCVQVAFLQEFFFDAGFCAFAEEGAVREDYSAASSVF